MGHWELLSSRQGPNQYYSSDYSGNDNTTAGLNKRPYLEWSHDSTECSADMPLEWSHDSTECFADMPLLRELKQLQGALASVK
jgi:hypothetical protein